MDDRIWSLSKVSFFFDIYFFAAIMLVLLGLIDYSTISVILIIAGYVVWTVFEYSLHRWIFHGPLIKQHWMHHTKPTEYIGAPSYISIGAFLLVSTVSWVFFSIPVVAALMLGFVAGYLYYLFIHTLTHQWTIPRNNVFYNICSQHRRHHDYAAGNYGITTGLWDRFLNSNLKSAI